MDTDTFPFLPGPSLTFLFGGRHPGAGAPRRFPGPGAPRPEPGPTATPGTARCWPVRASDGLANLPFHSLSGVAAGRGGGAALPFIPIHSLFGGSPRSGPAGGDSETFLFGGRRVTPRSGHGGGAWEEKRKRHHRPFPSLLGYSQVRQRAPLGLLQMGIISQMATDGGTAGLPPVDQSRPGVAAGRSKATALPFFPNRSVFGSRPRTGQADGDTGTFLFVGRRVGWVADAAFGQWRRGVGSGMQAALSAVPSVSGGSSGPIAFPAGNPDKSIYLPIWQRMRFRRSARSRSHHRGSASADPSCNPGTFAATKNQETRATSGILSIRDDTSARPQSNSKHCTVRHPLPVRPLLCLRSNRYDTTAIGFKASAPWRGGDRRAT